jgi:hypothetical protein
MNTHQMQVLDRTGHTTLTWSADSEEETRVAREAFNRMTEKGYRAFRVRRLGRQGERMDVFDPDAEEMILVPHLAGG